MFGTDSRLASFGRALWQASPALVVAGLGFLPVLGLSVLGLVIDDRLIGGGPAWLKPAKFAVSSSVYCLTLAAVFAAAGRTTRAMRWAGWAVAIVLVLEVGIIDVQAARGTTSHFNVSNPLNASLWAIMGISIGVLLVASATVVVELWRLPIADRVLGWTLRLGMAITVVGSATGGLMTQPTAAQLAESRVSGTMPTVGSHTVGARDGGPGLPITNWSRTHGDLRVPHFVGLHAIQVIPLLAWLGLGWLRLRSESNRRALVGLIAASYLGLIALLTAQALGGRSVVSLDAVSLGWWAFWGVLTVAGLVVLVIRDRVGVEVPRVPLGV